MNPSARVVAIALRSQTHAHANPLKRTGLVLILLMITALLSPVRADTFVVSNSADAGSGSLRQAMLDANSQQTTGGSHCARHTISFAIPGNGPHSIALLSALPRINIPMTLDGYSQPGAVANTLSQGTNAVLAIELDGSLAGGNDALVVGAAIPASPLCPGNTSIIRGLVINRFAGSAISMGNEVCPPNASCLVGAVLIQGNFIGTDVTGTLALGNGGGLGRPAVYFGTSSSFNIVGDEIPENGGPTDPLAQTRNLISGNGADAILIDSNSSNTSTGLAQEHRIRNNIIGLGASGTTALPNAGRGIVVGINATGISIYDNLISANGGDGVAVLDSPFPGTRVVRNGIGIGVGALPFGNGRHGVLVSGNALGVTVGSRFRFAPTAASIANNGGAGVFVEGNALVDTGNLSSAKNTGLALDLAPTGVNPNDVGDADIGPNELLNSPVLASVIIDATNLNGTISGSLNATPSSSYEIHFSYNDSCDPGGFGGGQTPFPLSAPPFTLTVTTDATGYAPFVRQTDGLPQGKFLTALARRLATSTPQFAFITSEYSNCKQIISTADQIFINGFDP